MVIHCIYEIVCILNLYMWLMIKGIYQHKCAKIAQGIAVIIDVQ